MIDNEFKIGLCLAGAVSAGTYSAGVMDYFIEALDNWENLKSTGKVPLHKVKIPVIGGASAGGMTSILTAVAIQNPINHVHSITSIDDKIVGNKFWNIWVDLNGDDIIPTLMATSDIKEGEIKSLLNSHFVDELTNGAVAIDLNNIISRPYFDHNLKFFVTLSSLRGFSFKVPFIGLEDENYYYVHRHNDYVAFVLNKNKEEYANDGWVPINFKNGTSVRLAKEAAMATGAFPAGLIPRRIVRDSKYVNDLDWHKDILKNNPITSKTFSSYNIDGGVINNEPFEKVREVINSFTNGNSKEFTSTTIMVDPFPSVLPQYHASDDLLTVLERSITTIVDQARIKPDEIKRALDKENLSQFIIAPSRMAINKDGHEVKIIGNKAIACGALGGFSGFIHKEFRVHDYFLGRKNCESFLRNYFTVPEDSDNIITRGYSHLSKEEREKYYPNEPIHSDKRLPIIPIVKNEKQEIPIFSSGTNWPIIEKEEIENHKQIIKKRVGAIIMNIEKQPFLSKIILGIGNRLLIRRKITNKILSFINQSLLEHELLRVK